MCGDRNWFAWGQPNFFSRAWKRFRLFRNPSTIRREFNCLEISRKPRTSRIPSQEVTGTGFSNRSSSSGGLAYGMPKNASTSTPRTFCVIPLTLPAADVTIGSAALDSNSENRYGLQKTSVTSQHRRNESISKRDRCFTFDRCIHDNVV